MKKSNLIITLVLLVVVAGIIGVFQFNKKVPTLDTAEADFSLSADALYEEFDQDEKAALAKYQDKIIEVAGTVKRTNIDSLQFNVVLKAKGSMTGGINCSMRQSSDNSPEKGSEIKVKGRCQGYLMDVVLNNCVFVQ